MESKTVVEWSWVAAQETFNRKCLPPLPPLTPALQCWCNVFQIPVHMTTLKRGGYGGNGVEWESWDWSMASFTTILFSFYRKTHYPLTTSRMNSALQTLLPYITRTCLVIKVKSSSCDFIFLRGPAFWLIEYALGCIVVSSWLSLC